MKTYAVHFRYTLEVLVDAGNKDDAYSRASDVELCIHETFADYIVSTELLGGELDSIQEIA